MLNVIVKETGEVLALDAEMRVQSVRPVKLPEQFRKLFPEIKQITLVTFGGDRIQLSEGCVAIPITKLCDFLLS